MTKYGIRSSCCGLWSWDRDPLVDKATHEARKHLGVLLKDLNGTIGAGMLLLQLKRHTTIAITQAVVPRQMNEVSCRKVIAACENILMDVMAGDIQPIAQPKKFK